MVILVDEEVLVNVKGWGSELTFLPEPVAYNVRQYYCEKVKQYFVEACYSVLLFVDTVRGICTWVE
jgi:hypothetical protein